MTQPEEISGLFNRHPLIGDADRVHSGTSGIRPIEASKARVRYVRFTEDPMRAVSG